MSTNERETETTEKKTAAAAADAKMKEGKKEERSAIGGTIEGRIGRARRQENHSARMKMIGGSEIQPASNSTEETKEDRGQGRRTERERRNNK